MVGNLSKAGEVAVDGQGNIYVIADGTFTTATGSFDIPVLKKFKKP